jgi:serine/threonine protein kinase
MVARDKEDLSGQQIGNYEIVSHIAARSASDLFLARDVKLERLVFLEVLRVTEKENGDLVNRFYRRMETVSHLKDSRIAVVSDLDVTDDGFPYAVIDYFPGETLAQKLAELQHDGVNLPVIEALELVKQIALGLGAAHAVGLIHHDLRPENVMLREDGAPVLIDLGLPVVAGAKALGVNGAETGLLDYAATEELEGKPATRRSNIYSLGVILYELLAGHRPRLPNLPYDIFPQANMPKEEPLEEARPGLAGETYRLVRNCLWRQEWSRFETAEELVTAIETAIFAEQELPTASAWTHRRGRSMAYVLPILLVVGAVLAFLALRVAFGGDNGATNASETPNGTFVAGADTVEPGASPTSLVTATPTQPAFLSSMTLLEPGAHREFGLNDTINFDWYWPSQPGPEEHFAVYLIDGDEEHQLGALRRPTNGPSYRLEVPVSALPVINEGIAWQVRLENIRGGGVRVASEIIPLTIIIPAPTGTATPTVNPSATATATPTAEACVPDPPLGWVAYGVRAGESASELAERGNVTVEFLLEVNCLEDDLLSIGQQIYVPLATVPRTPTPTPSPPLPTSPPSPTTTSAPAPPPNTPAPSPLPPTVEPTDEPTDEPTVPVPSSTPPGGPTSPPP